MKFQFTVQILEVKSRKVLPSDHGGHSHRAPLSHRSVAAVAAGQLGGDVIFPGRDRSVGGGGHLLYQILGKSYGWSHYGTLLAGCHFVCGREVMTGGGATDWRLEPSSVLASHHQ